MSPELKELCALAGVRDGYTDQTGRYRPTSEGTARALLSAMGHAVATDEEVAATLAETRSARDRRSIPDYLVLGDGEAREIGLAAPSDWHLATEGGETLAGHGDGTVRLPPLPPGIHRLTVAGDVCILLSAPPAIPPGPRAWGVTLPLYGLRTERDGGLSDFADLATAVRGLGAHGASFVGVNPIHMGFFPDAGEISPYAPSHRRRLTPAYIRAEGEAPSSRSARVDYTAAYAARHAALEAAFAAAGYDAEFEDFLEAEGRPLALFATHQALSEEYGPFWNDWPEAFRSPSSDAVSRFAAANRHRLRYHSWLQYIAEAQLRDVAGAARNMAYGLYLDVAVGTHPFGAETWLEPDCFARGVSLGAPPDAFSEDGQVWGLAPLNPSSLIRSGFLQVAEMLRKQFQFSKLIRIDHILGFDRAFWVPEAPDLPGAYVAMPKDALLAVARIEAARAGGTIIGEDLGNIPDGLQSDLAQSGVLGCRVVMFELDDGGHVKPPDAYPELSLASFGTHDLPTFAGWRTARDIAAREAIGSMAPDQAADARRTRETEVKRFDAAAQGDTLAAMEQFVARAGSRLVALQIEDVLGIEDQPNLPGTVDEYPNWRRRLPVAAGELRDDARVARSAERMTESGR